MELNFIGRGAAINPLEGNTSAYFIDNNEVFLIDCGESVYAPLIKLGVLNNYHVLNIFITHLHGDHVAGLGSLLVYTHFVLQMKVNLIVIDNDYLPNLEKLLGIFNTMPEQYNMISAIDLDNKYQKFSKVRYHKTIHAKNLDCYSLIFDTPNGIVYYSGDSAETKTIEDLIVSGQKIDKMYIDITTNKDGKVHNSLDSIIKVIPDNLKSKVYCMHYNNLEAPHLVTKAGFNIVTISEKC